jgi:hypothetical protein
MKPRPFRDRRQAGQLLATKLAAYANRPDVIVLALTPPYPGGTTYCSCNKICTCVPIK